MTIVKRTGLGRAMTWSGLDGNWDQVVESTAAAQQSAALAAASQAAAATSATSAAQSASDAANQAEAAGTLRTDLASTDTGKGMSLVSAEDGTNGQTFFDNADQFAGAYESAIITIKSANRWITYNGSRWYVKPGVTLPITTTGLNATSWETDSANFVNADSEISNSLINSDGFKNIGQASSFSDLRSITPESAGQKILLSSWNENTTPYGQSSFGGGEFIAVSGSGVDDGGFIAKVSDTWYWQRMKDPNLATIVDFGAIPDGTTDCHDAIVAMHTWAQSVTTRFFRSIPAIQLTEGNFYTTPVDLTSEDYQHFILRGPHVTYGYHASAVITSDLSSTAMFKTNARTCEISGIIVDGQNGTTANTQPFFDNTTGSITGGTYHRISQVWLQNLGGCAIKINDTLDTKIDQFYANSCVGGVVHIGYDNATSGNWDHPTAVEMTNFNIQDCITVAAFSMPRCLQSLIRNGWIERSYGGDFTNGHWLVESLSIENCNSYGVTDFTNSRTVFIQENFLASSVLRGYDQTTAWQTSFQPGQTVINNFGTTTLGSQSYGWGSPSFLINNTSSSGAWYNIGKLWLQNSGDAFKIICVGEEGWNNALGTETGQIYMSGQGMQEITLRKQANYYIRGTRYSTGNPGVKDVAVSGGSNASVQIYVYVAPYSTVGFYFVSNVLGSNELTIQSGTRTSTQLNWQPQYSPKTTSLPASYDYIPFRYSVSMTNADNSVYGGFGIASDGHLELRDQGYAGYTVGTTIAGYVPFYRNGTMIAIPYYSLTAAQTTTASAGNE
ncbi:MAG: hypothetical protein [Caudoviricetes sp.]|nr:MAG: hypothetical protein [Caudoviricetes sp.]